MSDTPEAIRRDPGPPAAEAPSREPDPPAADEPWRAALDLANAVRAYKRAKPNASDLEIAIEVGGGRAPGRKEEARDEP